MTKLLVSVRDVGEAKMAQKAGVDLIDVKEPRSGSLGAASPEVWHGVDALLRDEVPWSVACGELLDDALRLGGSVPAGCRFAKCGLAGCRQARGWTRDWKQWAEALPTCTSPVVVAYVDHVNADSPSLEDILRFAQPHANTVLLDTFDKSEGNLFAHVSERELRHICRWGDQNNIQVVLAGSLDDESLRQAIRLQPTYVAVRGAACASGRDTSLSSYRLNQIVEQVYRSNRGESNVRERTVGPKKSG